MRVKKPKSRKFAISKIEFKILNPKSAIRNPQFYEIRNPKSAIRNRDNPQSIEEAAYLDIHNQSHPKKRRHH
jgi:hypothetical protein